MIGRRTGQEEESEGEKHSRLYRSFAVTSASGTNSAD
jgi:hypothetical protein